jgi:DNA-binding GntR family transcriptional regulator
MSDQDRLEIHQLRKLLEVPPMQELAGDPRVIERRSEFRAIAHEIVAAAERGDYMGFIEADRRFHLGLLAITGNQRLVNAVGDLRNHTRQAGLSKLHESDQLRRTGEEHFDILDALVAGDRDLVGALMVQHLEHVNADWEGAESTSASDS